MVSQHKKMVLWCTSLLFSVFLAAVQVHGQRPSTEGFISIDCGSTGTSSDNVTGIPYTTDDNFIDTGKNYNVPPDYTNLLPQQYSTVRSFPDGNRNCYTLKPAIPNYKYLLRAGFMYGNYDKLNSVKEKGALVFDLQIGVNLWKTVNITATSYSYVYEAVIVSSTDFVSVCLIRTDSSLTPFISVLEMRQLKSTIYPTVKSSNFMVFFMRRNVGATTDKVIRYPEDPYDRIWKPVNVTSGVLTTASVVKNYEDDPFEVPSVVDQTAAVSAGLKVPIIFGWNAETSSPNLFYHVNLHFSEIEQLSPQDVREFSIYLNDIIWEKSYIPPYLMSGYIYSIWPLDHNPNSYIFNLSATRNATRPPTLNAFEVYSFVSIADVSMTRAGDVDAMMKIKAAYAVKKNWMGDPCYPREYAWDGLSCSNGGNDSRVIAVNLSSSGLVGSLSNSFSSLTAVEFLDLSYNNLSGKVPDSLATISSLKVLNLTGNCFIQIPDSLIGRSENGSLVLRSGNNTGTCNGSNTSPPGASPTPDIISKKISKKITTPIIIVIAVVPAILLIVVAILIVWRIRKKPRAVNSEVVQSPSENRQFNVNHGGSQPPSENHQFNVDHGGSQPPSENRQFNVDHGGSQLPSGSHQFHLDHDNQLPYEIRQFMYRELESITKDFSRTLGQGGFGTVFHGSLEDGTEVAVKMCSLSAKQAPTLFLAEVENLSKVRHKNLVSLVGYSTDRGCLAVVYEYMPLGSLEDHLRGKAGSGRTLSWTERLQIVLDAAQGLDYLYNGCPMTIIHRDVKSSNILLGQKMEAKVSDFGLSKAFHSDLQTHVSMTALAFSPGYVDPVCLQSWKFNEKSDVYSFGVLLLEIITGEPPFRYVGDSHIIERAQTSFGVGDLNAIVDAKLQGVYSTESVWKVAELAMNCTRTINRRPRMAEVVTQLRDSLECETAERSKSVTVESIGSSQGITITNESAIFAPLQR